MDLAGLGIVGDVFPPAGMLAHGIGLDGMDDLDNGKGVGLQRIIGELPLSLYTGPLRHTLGWL
jgi:hypothetical protein